MNIKTHLLSGLLLMVISLIPVAVLGHPVLSADVPAPIAPKGGDARAQALEVFWCTCSEDRRVKLQDPACDCADAKEDRAEMVSDVLGMGKEEQASGKAALQSILNAIEVSPRLRRSIVYSQERFDHLWDTTRSVCPAELGKVYRIGPISCRIRGIWSLRFKAMLALGYSTDSIFDFYVEEVNADHTGEEPYTAHGLKYVPAGNTTIFFPFVGIACVALAFLFFGKLKGRVQARREPEPLVEPGLSDDERAMLAEELEDSGEI